MSTFRVFISKQKCTNGCILSGSKNSSESNAGQFQNMLTKVFRTFSVQWKVIQMFLNSALNMPVTFK